ncbi:coiled-coil domain-containing protein 138-like isoform X2 [Notolabrus celidotus]|uniref:coiled-coil domain-containing protein 138-like isoform X2 n=1 Tax=Notolabrus celidotus TaxID=1203425 RepID=UPI00148F4DBC|nr:coiled-coil domain-containing protein 138-like isoform X2 [Notolabrus celidotus]
MNLHFKIHHTAETVEELTQKYLSRRKQMLRSEDIISGTNDETEQRLIYPNRSKRRSKDMKCYSKALHDLFKAFTNHPDNFGSDLSPHDSNEDLREDSTADRFQDSQVLFTETDVTLPSCLDGSPGSQENEINRKFQRAHQLPDSSPSSTLVLAEVYQEMMTIYEQLRAERQSQHEWERELEEREKRLKQHKEAFGKLAGLEEMLHTRMYAVEEKHKHELGQLQDLLREKNKENKRLKSSFDIIKEQNDNMKKQMKAISEQNEKLESQAKRVQARLDNLQRKFEHNVSSRVCEKVSVKSTEGLKPSKKEKTAAAGKPRNKGCSGHTSAKLLALLLDWILDGQIVSSAAGNKGKGVDQCLPPEVLLNERCLKVLPLLADQLHRTPPSEDELLLNLLRVINLVLGHMDSTTLHVALSATLRRIGEQVSKLSAPSTMSEDPDRHKYCSVAAAAGPCRSWPLYRSPCPHTRILSTLIVFRTVTQADVLAQALDSLHTELMSEESRGLFIHYGGVCVLLSMLQAGRGGLHTPVDILMQLTEQSRYLNTFLESCSCEEFFHTASRLLKNPRLELSSLEKLSILLQKLSSIRKNRRLFEVSSLHLQLQELYHRTNRTHTFLRLNLRSILHHLQ